jgi:hypothetical protein
MFCPKCRAEYREGFRTCADCNIELVDELAPEPEPEFVDYEEILATYNRADMALIKSILDAENITYFFKGEYFAYVNPLADPARLMVRKDQVRDAKNVLKGLKLSYLGVSLDKNSEEGEEQDS